MTNMTDFKGSMRNENSRIYYNVKTTEEARKKAREQHPEFYKAVDEMKEAWNAMQEMKPIIKEMKRQRRA